MFLYDKTNILEGSGIFEVDFAPSHEPAIQMVSESWNFTDWVQMGALREKYF